jgi:hypothetical protein
VLIDQGRHRVDATLRQRADVNEAFPWYPVTTHPAFEAVVPRRPPGVAEATDVQIEIVDGAGRVTRSHDLLIQWR